MSSQFTLLKQQRFVPYFLTQFFGAFNDNVFKNSLIIFITFQMATNLDTNMLVNVSAGLFILPFFLFSATAGQIADKYEKSQLIRWIKLAEIIIMAFAAVGFYLQDVTLLISVLFLMGAQSSVFGPVKYAILPQHLKTEELVGGNGLVEMGTFLAILLGTMAGGILIGLKQGGAIVSVIVIFIAILGYLSSRYIPTAPAVAPELIINWNPITQTWRGIQFARNNRTVFLSILGISWFWFLGAAYLAQLPNYTKEILGSNEQVVTILLTLFSLGIGIGSLLCERLSGKKVEIGLVPFGSIGLTIFGIDLFFAKTSATPTGEIMNATQFFWSIGSWRLMIDLTLIGLFGGFYIVPLYALVQQRSEPSQRSRIIAANNILNALFMVFSAILAIVLLKMGLNIPQLFLIFGIFNAFVALYIYSLVPEFLMRFLVWLLIHTIYRIEEEGLEKIPEEGAAILVCNHVSFVDALVIGGAVRRPVRFVTYYKIYQIPVLNFIFRTARTIPIASRTEDPIMLERAYDEISAALRTGELICIFPEGKLTRDGELDEFKRGIEKAIQRDPVPVIPTALRGLWGSIFSYKQGSILRILRCFTYKMGFVVGESISPEEVTAERLRQEVLTLRGNWK